MNPASIRSQIARHGAPKLLNDTPRPAGNENAQVAASRQRAPGGRRPCGLADHTNRSRQIADVIGQKHTGATRPGAKSTKVIRRNAEPTQCPPPAKRSRISQQPQRPPPPPAIAPTPVLPIQVPSHLHSRFVPRTSPSPRPPADAGHGTTLRHDAPYIYHQEEERRTATGPLDHLWAAEYDQDIDRYLREVELLTLPDVVYASYDQHKFTMRTRESLMDWIVHAHHTFRLFDDTLFLACNIADRLLSHRKVHPGRVKLVGMAALVIATKYEQGRAPSIRQLIYFSGDLHTEHDVIATEHFILQVLNYNLAYPTPLQFLHRTTKHEEYSRSTRAIARYLVELSCVGRQFMYVPPSKLAASAIWLSHRITGNGPPYWTLELIRRSGYYEHELATVACLMMDHLASPSVEHLYVFQKWSSEQLLETSIVLRGWAKSPLAYCQ